MSVNKYLPHVLVLPEDDANRQLVNGFILDQNLSTRKIQVLEVAGGWNEVVICFLNDHVAGMEIWADRFMVLVIDFDGKAARLQDVKARIPGHLTERVFILGTLTEPEALRQCRLGSYEEIGLAMARDCRDGTNTIWGHDLLRHNESELVRLRQRVRPILFPSG